MQCHAIADAFHNNTAHGSLFTAEPYTLQTNTRYDLSHFCSVALNPQALRYVIPLLLAYASVHRTTNMPNQNRHPHSMRTEHIAVANECRAMHTIKHSTETLDSR